MTPVAIFSAWIAGHVYEPVVPSGPSMFVSDDAEYPCPRPYLFTKTRAWHLSPWAGGTLT